MKVRDVTIVSNCAAAPADLMLSGARREVDHRHDAARRHQREERHHRADRVRQHQADRLALGRQRHQLATEHAGADQRALVGHGAGDRILEGSVVGPVLVRGVDHRLEHGAVGRGGLEHHLGHDGVERGAGGLPAGATLQFGRDLDAARRQDRHLDALEPAPVHLGAVQVGEARVLRALDPYRYDGCARLVGDEAGAVIDLHQAAGARDATLGEDHQRGAALHRLDQLAGGERPRRVERQRVHVADHGLHPPLAGPARVDREDRVLVEHGKGDRRVEQADVVQGDDRVGTGGLEVLPAVDLEPIEDAEHQHAEIAQRIGRQHGQDPDRGAEAGDAEDQEDRREAGAELLQHDGRDEAGDDAGGIQHVDGGDHASALVRRRPGLHRGEGGNDVKAAGHRQQQEIEPDVPGAPSREEDGGRQQRPHRFGAMERRGVMERRGEIERDQAEHRGGDRGRQHQRAPGQQPGGEAGAERDADREQRVVDVEDDGVAAETQLDDRRQQRVDDHRHGPEQAGDDRAAPKPPVGAQRAQQAPCRCRDVGFHLQGRRRLPRRRDEARRDIGDGGKPDAQPRRPAHVVGRTRRQRRGGRSEDRGDEGRALDQGVAAG